MSTAPSTTMARRAAIASFTGSIIEWYDFNLYGLAAALVFNKVFFTSLSPAVGVVVAFATFAAGFVIRPLGALFFGHLGDRIGRKPTMIATLWVMGVGTVLIGALPGYQTLGVAAPLLLVLLRLVQGFGVGGEESLASVLAVEHAQPHRRGLNGSSAFSGSFVGILIGTGVFAAISMMPDDSLLSWGWRIPFLAGAAITVVAYFVRRGVRDTPHFLALVEGDQDRRSRLPVASLVRTHWKQLTAIALLIGGPNTIFLTVMTFSVSYGKQQYGIDPSVILSSVTIGLVVAVFVTTFAGWVSDKVGRKLPITVGVVAESCFYFFFWWALSTARPGLIVLSMILVLGFGHALYNGVLPALMCDFFPAAVRASGVSIGQQVGGTIGGFGPLLAASFVLVQQGGWSLTAGYGLALCLVGLGLLAAVTRRVGWLRPAPASPRDDTVRPAASVSDA